MSPNFGIYIHLPFCSARCSYCPFAVSTDLGRQDAYLIALRREIDSRSDRSLTADTLFFGGGTPSLTRADDLGALVDQIRNSFQLSGATEISIEANPEDVTAEVVSAWRNLGIGRISIGIQSLHDAELRPLGRTHGPARALEAIRIALASGARTSADLILGLPGQTRATFRESLGGVLAEGVGHLSLYMLDLEEGTTLESQVRSGRVELPGDEQIRTMYLEAIDLAGRSGLAQYEISNFARPGEESLHNRKYWRREPYLGFGLGAHSYIPEQRFANSRNLEEYLASIEAGSSPESFREQLSEDEIRHEKIFLALRQSGGIGYSELKALSGAEGERWIDEGALEGWIRREGDRVGFTPEGFLVSSELLSRLF